MWWTPEMESFRSPKWPKSCSSLGIPLFGPTYSTYFYQVYPHIPTTTSSLHPLIAILSPPGSFTTKVHWSGQKLRGWPRKMTWGTGLCWEWGIAGIAIKCQIQMENIWWLGMMKHDICWAPYFYKYGELNDFEGTPSHLRWFGTETPLVILHENCGFNLKMA